jgi:hypothetical protein
MPQCYSIPASLVDSFPDHYLIIRSPDLSELVGCLSKVSRDRVCYVELTSLEGDPDIFLEIDAPLAFNLVLDGTPLKFSSLYKFTGRPQEKHPIRVTVPASPGFGKAVKLAVSLGFPVKIEATQPSPDLIKELMAILDYYLHNTTVSQPIEFFHSMLISFFRSDPVTIWQVQEEDPQIYQYITDNGKTVLSRRLQTIEIHDTDSNYLDNLKSELLLEQGECSTCPYFSRCLGYFKLPDRQFKCHDIRRLLGVIEEAASTLVSDYEKFRQLGGV